MRTKALLSQPERYRRLLLAKRAELLSAPPPEGLRDPVKENEDDQGPILHEQFVASQIQGLDRQTLKLIDLALERLETPQYGVCQECGDPITSKRLMAIPWAEYCISCQDRAGANTNDDQRAA